MSTMRDCVKTPPYKNKQVSLRLTPGVFKSSQQPKNSIVLTARQKLFVSELCLKEIEKFSPKMQLRRNENSKNRNSLRNPQPQLPIDEYTLKVPKMTDRMVINSTTMSRLQHSLKKTVLSKITDSLLKKKI